MGLTLHYKLKAKGSETLARKLVEALHQKAHDLPFKEIGGIVDLEGDDCDYDKRGQDDPLRWLLCQSSGSIHIGNGEMGDRYLNVLPLRIIAFQTWPGEGCEAANFGFCLYPATIEHDGKHISTNMAGWRWSSFCKTQYASDPSCGGVQNFLRCHFSVIAMLDQAKTLGCLESVSDEGRFWEDRNVEALVKEIGSWNQMIAAFGGKLKDVLGDGVEMPIASYPNFEQLELAGQSQLPPDIEQLANLIKQVGRKS